MRRTNQQTRERDAEVSHMAGDNLSSKFDESTRKFTTSQTVNILHDPHLMHLTDQHQWQRYDLYRRHEQTFPKTLISPIHKETDEEDLIEDLRSLTEHRLPDLCALDGEPMEMTRGQF